MAEDLEVSRNPICERLHKLRHTSVIGFLDHHLVDRRNLISCDRADGPLYAPSTTYQRSRATKRR
jgi:hypothetical protein